MLHFMPQRDGHSRPSGRLNPRRSIFPFLVARPGEGRSEDHLWNRRIKIGRSDRLFVLTGAGISAESGIPTFRGQEGSGKDTGRGRGHSAGFYTRPGAGMAFLLDAPFRSCQLQTKSGTHCTCPPGGKIGRSIADLHAECGFALHEAAGSKRVLHMHGQLFQSRCSNGGVQKPFKDTRTLRAAIAHPQLHECGALLRPHICWFDESPFHMKEVIPALEECAYF